MNSFNRIFQIALQTWKSFVRDRIFYAVIVVAFLMLGFSYLLATLTIIESRKILLDFGFAAVSLSGAVISIFVGIQSVAKEISNRTIYTIISKPISRHEYIIGKFFGATAIVAGIHLSLASVVCFILRTSQEEFPSGILSCFTLITMENIIVLSTACVFSVFTSSFLAASFTFAIFLIGRSSTALCVLSQRASTGEVRSIAKVLYIIMPNLERYNIRDVVAYGKPYPAEIPWQAGFYFILYISFSISITSLIFQKRELP